MRKGQRRSGAAGAVRGPALTAALPTGGAGRLRGPWSGGGAAAAPTPALLHPCGRARWGAGAAAAAGRPGGAEGGGGAGAACGRVCAGGAAAPGSPQQRLGAELRYVTRRPWGAVQAASHLLPLRALPPGSAEQLAQGMVPEPAGGLRLGTRAGLVPLSLLPGCNSSSMQMSLSVLIPCCFKPFYTSLL